MYGLPKHLKALTDIRNKYTAFWGTLQNLSTCTKALDLKMDALVPTRFEMYQNKSQNKSPLKE